MTIGERIKQARKANRLSLRALADEAEISAMAISKYERGLAIPSSAVLLRLARALDVSTDFMLRPISVSIQLQACRKQAALGVKDLQTIQMRIQEWLERYLEIESFFPDGQRPVSLPVRPIHSLDQVEEWAVELGANRTTLDVVELRLLKRKYGLSMQAWIFRAKDLGIISENEATRLSSFSEPVAGTGASRVRHYPLKNPCGWSDSSTAPWLRT